MRKDSTLFDRIASEILSVYRDLCPSVRLELIGCKVLAGFVLENTDEQSFTVISIATGEQEKNISLRYFHPVYFRENKPSELILRHFLTIVLILIIDTCRVFQTE